MIIATSTSEDSFYVWADVCGTGFDLDIRLYAGAKLFNRHRRTAPLIRPLSTSNDLIKRYAEVVKR